MEEFIGKIWHRYITNRANTHYPDAIVYLDDIRRSAGIFFRALGGEGGLRIETANESDVHAKRSLAQRIAGAGQKTQYAWRDEETLRLPSSISLFPDKQHNKNLYLWLTALSVVDGVGDDWISRNQYRTLKTLEQWPGLKAIYEQLVKAHLLQRPDPNDLTPREAAQENKLRLALNNLEQEITLEYAKRPPHPVMLWLHPSPPMDEMKDSVAPTDPDLDDNEDKEKKQQSKQIKRKKGRREDMPDGKEGLLSFRLETLWSWGEYTKVNRTTIDDDDDNSMQTAEDMNDLSLAKDKETTAGKIKLDLDLPSEQYDDVVLSDGIPIDEWDYKKQTLQKDHCRLIEMSSRQAEARELPEKLRAQAHKVRRQFEALRPQRQWVNKQSEGSELDLENYVNYVADRHQGVVRSDLPIYRDVRNLNRDLSCLLLADLSLSTDAYVNNHSRVIDVIKDSLYLFSEALTATGDRFALHGFSSRNRNHVRFYNIKGFDEHYNNDIRGHIDAMRPGYYTRMGTAIRHATNLLVKEKSEQKLLLIVTDGKPNDIDKYEGRYGIEDTRMAVLEAEKQGLRPFCVTIDEKAEDYLPYLFGSKSYVLIHNAEDLPKKLPLLYCRLTY